MVERDPKNPPIVPNGWLAKYDEKYRAFFYVDLRTKKSQWEAPSFEHGDEMLPPHYSPTTSNGAQSQVQTQARPNPQQPHPQLQLPPQGYGHPPQQQQGFAPQQQYVQQMPQNMHVGGMGGMGGMGIGGGMLGGMLLGNMMGSRRHSRRMPRRSRRC
ncbi:unnamed protein product [Debaryomyces tyrocola]|nr:unnamed protein product [Debaryomyces tyrocola]